MSLTLWSPQIGDINSISGMPIGVPGGFVTASTTHTLAGSPNLPGQINLVNAANANDSVQAPFPALPGAWFVVISVGSTATMAIFPDIATDKIDGGTAGAFVTLTAAHRGAMFFCAVAGNWVTSLFGTVAS